MCSIMPVPDRPVIAFQTKDVGFLWLTEAHVLYVMQRSDQCISLQSKSRQEDDYVLFGIANPSGKHGLHRIEQKRA